MTADFLSSKPLHSMFTEVPPRYDLINSVITWNMDKGWRKAAASACLADRPARVLDLCCGTGDLAIILARLARFPLEIQGLDYSPPMLARAEEKAARLAPGKKIRFVRGEADNLPFPAGQFNCVAISFAFRNLTYKNPLASSHLAEILRVLCPGGRLVIVESSQPKPALVRAGFHLYLRGFVARAGNWLSGNRGAYHYLAESASRYYSPSELRDFLIASGFRDVSHRPLFFGAAGLTIATR
jgi:demethylmenaquinone methyltransferase / 2-methoxy-6-polyprenyl-1,4-benzoquinol methylase